MGGIGWVSGKDPYIFTGISGLIKSGGAHTGGPVAVQQRILCRAPGGQRRSASVLCAGRGGTAGVYAQRR